MPDDKPKIDAFLMIYVTIKMKSDLRWLAYKNHTTMSEIIRNAIQHHLDKQDLE